MAEAERKFVSQSIRFETEDQFNQLEAALLGAGYHWYLNARDTAQKNRIVNLGCDGSVCGVLNSGAAIPFAEGLALLGSPVEEKADPPAPRMEWRDARVEDIGKGLKLRATTTERLQWCGEDSHWDRLGVNPRGGFAVHGVPWKYVQVLAPAEVTEPEAPRPITETGMLRPGMAVEVAEGSAITATSMPGVYSINLDSIFADSPEVTYNPFPLYTENPMTEPKTTIERRIAMAAGRILWKAAWPVRKLTRGILKGAENMFYAALFGGVCYGGYELYQFLQAVKITLPE